MLRQLHVIPDLAVSAGGMGVAALRLAESLCKAGADVTVFATSRENEQLTRSTVHSSRFRLIHGPSTTVPIGQLKEIYRAVNRLVQESQYELIHMHGTWRPLHLIAALIARKQRVPFVVSPHGSLDDWALRQKWLKKWFALKTYQGIVNRKAAMFFATSIREMKSLRRLGICQPVAMIPIGIDVQDRAKVVARKGKRSILFLSRLHPAKGLFDLVEAWRRVRNENWRIVIVGPDVNGHKFEVQRLISFYGLESDFEFLNQVHGEQKQTCYENADLFILPSRSESFGIAILEALANQLPVITTTGTPWKEIQDHKCGWWVDPCVAEIASAIQEAMAMSPEALNVMGHKGRKLVEEKYSWDKIAQEYSNAYHCLLNMHNINVSQVK